MTAMVTMMMMLVMMMMKMVMHPGICLSRGRDASTATFRLL